jgi:hypothetical protein
MAATTASPAVMERLAQAEAAERPDPVTALPETRAALAGALSKAEPSASIPPRQSADAMLEALADMVAERLAAQRR